MKTRHSEQYRVNLVNTNRWKNSHIVIGVQLELFSWHTLLKSKDPNVFNNCKSNSPNNAMLTLFFNLKKINSKLLIGICIKYALCRPTTMSFFTHRRWRTSIFKKSAAPSLGCANFWPMNALGTIQLVSLRSPGTRFRKRNAH